MQTTNDLIFGEELKKQRQGCFFRSWRTWRRPVYGSVCVLAEGICIGGVCYVLCYRYVLWWKCKLRIRDVYPGSDIYPSRISDRGSRISDRGSRIPDLESKNSNKREGWKKICSHTLFYSHTFHKIENYFIYERLKKKIWANFQRIIELFTQKLSLSSQKYGFGIRDPRSGIRDPRSGMRDPEKTYSGSWIRDPGVKKTSDPGFRIPDPDAQHWV